MWLDFFRKKKNNLRLISADLNRNDFQTQVPWQWRVLFVTHQLSAVSSNCSSLWVFSQAGFASFEYKLEGKKGVLFYQMPYLDVIYIREKKCEKYEYLHFKHNFRVSVVVHSSAFWLFATFSSLLFDCTSRWASLAWRWVYLFSSSLLAVLTFWVCCGGEAGEPRLCSKLSTS